MTTENLILNRLRDRIGIDAAQVGEAALRRDIRRAVAADALKHYKSHPTQHGEDDQITDDAHAHLSPK